MSEKTVFKKIIDKELPSYTVYEDERFLAFLDIFPKAPGDLVLIPKEEYRFVWDVPYIDDYFRLVQKLAKAQQKAFATDMIRAEVYGEEVPHAHVKIWPHLPCDGSEKNFAMIQEKIMSALA